MSDRASEKLKAKAKAVVLSEPAGIKVADVAMLVGVSVDSVRRALCALGRSGGVVLVGRGPSSRWAPPETAEQVRAQTIKQQRQQVLETNRRSRRAHREREKVRPFDDNDTAQDYFTQTWREAGTWEHQTTGVLAPATWLCPALG